MVMVEDVLDPEGDNFLKTFEEARVAKAAHKGHMPAAFAAAARMPPVDATVIADPYKAYLRENKNSDKPTEPVHVTAESSALRAILPTVDGQDKIKAILDPGCQIVAMSEEVCNVLALPYDPTI